MPKTYHNINVDLLLTVVQILAFASSTNLVREVKNLPPNCITTFFMLQITPIWIGRPFYRKLNQFCQKSLSKRLCTVNTSYSINTFWGLSNNATPPTHFHSPPPTPTRPK